MRGSTNAQKAETDLTSVNSAITSLQNGKQDKLTFDTVPVSGSSNPITSGAVYTALESAGGGGLTQVSEVYPITVDITYNSIYLSGQAVSYSKMKTSVGYTHYGTGKSGTITLSEDGSAVYSGSATMSYTKGSISDSSSESGTQIASETISTPKLPASIDISGLIGGKKTGTATVSGYLIGDIFTTATKTLTFKQVPISNGITSSAVTGANLEYATVSPDSSGYFNRAINKPALRIMITSIIFTPS